MILPFHLNRLPVIHFGTGQISSLPGILKTKGDTVLVLTGANSFRTNKDIMHVIEVLHQQDHTLLLDQVSNEPSPADVDRITGICRSEGVDAVVAIGGGSVLDAGKAVSAMLPLEGSVRTYLEGVGTKAHPGVKKYFVAVPTTSGTGSEATANAVISETGEKGFKRSLRHENLVPDAAIVDPQLVVGCPPNITAASGMDAFTQLLESYLSVKSGDLMETLAVEGMASVSQYLQRAYEQGDDLEARSHMAYAALLSGITLANAGLGLVHGFASVIGGLYRIPHGIICGRLMGPVNRHNVRKLLQEGNHNTALEKYAALGAMFYTGRAKSRDWYAGYVADYIEGLIAKLSLPGLGSFGLQKTDLEKIAGIAGHKENPVRFSHTELVGMLTECL